MTIHKSFRPGVWYVLNTIGDTVFRGTWDQCCSYAERH